MMCQDETHDHFTKTDAERCVLANRESAEQLLSRQRSIAADRLLNLTDRERGLFAAWLSGWVGITDDPELVRVVSLGVDYVKGFDESFVRYDGADEALRSVGLKEGNRS